MQTEQLARRLKEYEAREQENRAEAKEREKEHCSAVQELKSQIEKSEASYTEKEQKMKKDHEKQCLEYKSKVSLLQDSISEMEVRYEKEKASWIKTKLDLEDSLRGHREELAEVEETMRARVSALQTQVREGDRRAREAEAKLEDVCLQVNIQQDCLAEAENKSQTTVTRLQSRVSSLETDLKEARAEVEHVRLESERESQAASDLVQDLNQNIDSLKRRVDELKNEAIESNREWEEKLQRADGHVTSLARERDDLEEALHAAEVDLQKSCSLSNTRRDEMETLRVQLAHRETELEENHQRVSELTEEVEATDSERKLLEASVVELTRKLTAVEAEAVEMKATLSAAKKLLQGAVERLARQVNRQVSKDADLTSSCRQLDSMVDHVMAVASSSEATQEETMSVIAQLKATAEKWRSDHQRLSAQSSATIMKVGFPSICLHSHSLSILFLAYSCCLAFLLLTPSLFLFSMLLSAPNSHKSGTSWKGLYLDCGQTS